MIHQPELRPTSRPLPGDHGECDWGAEMPDRQGRQSSTHGSRPMPP